MQLNLNKLAEIINSQQISAKIYKIPKGQTKTYKEIAILVGSPKSSRAVANACAKNPFPITLPCHRVIKSDGSIGGYSAEGGVRKKKALLSKESNEK